MQSTRRLVPLPLLALLAGCAAPAEGPAGRSSFPEAWLGTWRGDAQVLSAEGARAGSTMRLDVARTEHPAPYLWTTTYAGPAGERVRDYELVCAAGESVTTGAGETEVASYRPGRPQRALLEGVD